MSYPKLSQMTVLLVEDNQINQYIFGRYLKFWGINFDLAEDGEVAIEKARTKKYDLILMDLFLPNIDGIEATKRLRQQPSSYFKDLLIVGLTASNCPSHLEAAHQAGLDLCLDKVMAPSMLYTSLENLLLKSSQMH